MGAALPAIREHLVRDMAELLRVPNTRIDTSASFLEQGADSIVLVEAVRRIERHYGLRVGIQQFFEQTNTIDELAAWIAERADGASAAQHAERAPSEPSTPATTPSLPSAPSAVAAPATERAGTGTAPPASGQLGLMQAQLALVRHTIEQQHRLLAQRQPPARTAPAATPPRPRRR